jgi:hypothetical protein
VISLFSKFACRCNSYRYIEATRSVEATAYAGQPAAVFKLKGPLFFGSVTSFKAGLYTLNSVHHRSLKAPGFSP